MAGLLRGIVHGRRPLADVIFPIHLCSVLLVAETLLGLAFAPLGIPGSFLAVGATLLAVTAYCFAALRRAYGLGGGEAARVTLLATALFAPAYFVSLCLQLVVILLVFTPLVILTELAVDAPY
ncbi:MAG: hypothetical protein Q8P18_29740 [Pseudomonadota bacterium]|nr:hypothetical protein [Pseudomonadota bacterium]